ncbi:claspin-like isoform X2 [Pygocentrus nattereri]|uniref:claspin-like isoform X2 n=1 Tax=Pygocentrus nattereri TaxID=42514 RepID=UPI00189163DE|nr:claspin-like isoform X2 [Pygocentrus nattereri]
MDRFITRLKKLREHHKKQEEKYQHILNQQEKEQQKTLELLNKSMENTKPVGRVRPNKKAEQEESDESINLSEEDLVSSHSEYEPDGSESDSESCLSLSTQLSSSSVLSKEVENDGECPPGEKKQKTSSRAPSPQDHLETGVEGSCGEQQSDGECLPGKKKEKRSSKASSPKDKLATCEEDSCGEEKSNRECSPVKKKQKMSSGASSQEDHLETSDKDTSAEQQSENVRSPVRKKRPSSRTQNADLVEDVETRKSDRKHTVQPRRPWTDREKEAVWRHLTKYRALKNVPGKADCLRCIQAELALKTRTWKDIKNFVYNSITTEKRKAASLITKT